MDDDDGNFSLVDLHERMFDSSSHASLAKWRTQCEGSPWLAMSGDDGPSVPQHARSAGAQGFEHKQATREVFGRDFADPLAGQFWFGPGPAPDAFTSRWREWAETTTELGLMHRQCDILSLVASSLPNRRIALLLGLSDSTAKQLPTGLMKRLGVKTRVEILTPLRVRSLVLEKHPCA